MGATEAGHEHGKLEARHASLDDTELHSDAIENEIDVGHGTGEDVPGGESAPEVVVLGSPSAGSGRRDSTITGRIRRMPR